MSTKREKAYLFEKNATLEEIRNIALRMKCQKIDLEYVRDVKTKEQLVDYLHSRQCPALLHLEAKQFPF
jgi:hypothetical protein